MHERRHAKAEPIVEASSGIVHQNTQPQRHAARTSPLHDLADQLASQTAVSRVSRERNLFEEVVVLPVENADVANRPAVPFEDLDRNGSEFSIRLDSSLFIVPAEERLRTLAKRITTERP